MENIKVSVIVPVWGVENFIERCARHLFEQTLEEMEFIFVDDCTPDKSIEVLNKVISDYPNRKQNIIILHHKENLGLPMARRTGIAYAKGEYIAHHDSDDWVDFNTYESMYETAIKEKSDVVVCPFFESDGTHVLTELKAFPKAKNAVLSNKLSCWENEGSLCNKIFRRQLYKNDIVFPKANMGEDMCLVYQLIHFCRNVSVVSDVHYYIYKNQSSITRVRTQHNIYKNFLQGIENCKIVLDFYSKHNVVDDDTNKALLRLKYSKREILRSIVGVKKYRKIWCSTFPEIDKSIFMNNGLTLREKIKSLMIRFGLFPLPWKKCTFKPE